MKPEVESDQTSMIILIVMLCIFALLGTIGNGLSTFVFYKIREKTSAQIFILSLSLIDLFTCSIIIPFTIVVEYLNYKVKYDIVCKLYQFLITSKVPLSAFMMVAIALDRYLCICHPLKRIVNPFRTKVVVACLVVFACALGVATSLGYGVYYKFNPQEKHPVFNDTDPDMLLDMMESDWVENQESLLEKFGFNLTDMDISLLQEPIDDHPRVIYIGVCKPYLYGFYLNKNYLTTYQLIYTSLFVVCLIVVGVLYSLIYHFIKSRRSKKLRQKLVMCTYTQEKNGMDSTKTKLLEVNSNINNKENNEILQEEDKMKHAHRQSHSKRNNRMSDEAEKLREETRAANIKTAAMLFIVSVVYIIAFTPAWLVAHQILKSKIVFYSYFSYNVANPLIYAFMNQIFKEHLRSLLSCCR